MGDNKQAKFTSQGVNCFELIHPQAIPDAFNRDKRQNRDRPFCGWQGGTPERQAI